MNQTQRLRVALICALTQWGLVVVLQTRSYFGFVLPPSTWTLLTSTAFLTVIPFIQAQNAVVAGVFGCIAYLVAGYRRLAWVFFTLYCAVSAYLLIDEVYYKVFRDHVHLDMFEGGRDFNAVITLSSFASEVDWFFYCAAILAIAGAVWFGRALVVPPEHPRNLRRIFIFAGVLALAGIPAFSSSNFSHVNEHPLIMLAHEVGQRDIRSVLTERTTQAQKGTATPDAPGPAGGPKLENRDPRLAALLAASHARKPRPNLVLIVLESVGSVNALGADQLPVARVTPNLARLARNGVVFNSLYTTFPGTTRSMVSLHTGGRQFTYGSVAELSYQYKGPLLPDILSKSGYATAFFSSERMDGEGTDVFLKKAGYETFYNLAADPAGTAPQNQISSWGSRDEFVLPKVEEWIRGIPKGHPFFLEYMTVATHHPYTIPADYHAPITPHNLQGAYLNALNYTDHSIQVLIEFLEKRGDLKDTIFAVTGDHGESFGDLHTNNLVHGEAIYDENCREFLLLWDGQFAARKLIPNAITSDRSGANGDIMPTLLALLDLPMANVPGRNLLAENFEIRPVYFHKLLTPETWGVRDGRWKYIGELRSDAAELYDLAVDPQETRNLAGSYPDQVKTYRAMCQRWYLQSEHDYSARLADYPGVDSRLDSGDTQLGPRTLAVGFLRPKDGLFVETSEIDPRQPIVAWTKWAISPDSSSHYEWIAPSGRIFVSQQLTNFDTEWNTTSAPFPGSLPLEEGNWIVQLRSNGSVRMSAHFSVRRGAKLPEPGSVK